jgi:LmbE family N-acetylglucosaminyl deacetylase
MSVLVIAPHPDDESIGCGGAICLHARRGERVVVAFLTSGELGLKHLAPDRAREIREAEAARATQILGVAATYFLRLPDWEVGDHLDRAGDDVAQIVREERSVTIYLPHAAEWHPDHQAALPVARRALRQQAGPAPPPLLKGYEVWTPLAEHDDVEDVSPVMSVKLHAVRCYASQLNGFRYDQAVRGLNRYRGALAARVRYAEVFRHL